MITSDAMMLEFKDDIAFMTIYGKMTEEDMGLMLDWLKAEAQTHDSFNMCLDLQKFEWPSLDAVKEEFSRLGEVFKLIKSVEKYAVITDNALIRTAARVEGALIPGLKVKGFESEERDEALAWLRA